MQNRRWLSVGLLMAFATAAWAQEQTTPSRSSQTPTTTQTAPSAKTDVAPTAGAPAGTVVEKRRVDTEVQPVAKRVKVTPSLVKAAQQRLADKGYNPGPADGVAGPQTHAALMKFQADEGLNETGRLDGETLAKLDVGSTQMIGSAPADIGRGGKAFGHNIKEGHPVAAGKAIGTGSANFGKKVGRGAKSGAIGVKDKVGEGLSKIGDKVSGKSDSDEQPSENPQ